MSMLNKTAMKVTSFLQKGTRDAAAHDLRSTKAHVLLPGERILVKTGFSCAIPRNHAGLVCSRSGMALKAGVAVLNAPGIIDPDYRGEIGVILINHGNEKYVIEKGDRVAQFMLIRTRDWYPNLVANLSDTARSISGFGSTGDK